MEQQNKQATGATEQQDNRQWSNWTTEQWNNRATDNGTTGKEQWNNKNTTT
jgi:hypothetical protein